MPDSPQRTLTEADLDALAERIKGHSSCNLGLTPEEVSTLKRFIAAFDKAAGLVGTIILTAIVVGLIGLLTKGFWASLVSGIKTAIAGK